MKNKELMILLILGILCMGVGLKCFIDDKNKAKELQVQAQQSQKAQEKNEYNTEIFNKLPEDCLHPLINTGKCYVPYDGPSGYEDYCNYDEYDVSKVIDTARKNGFSEEKYPYHINEYGLKMIGDYIIVSAKYEFHPYGTIIDTSLGKGIVLDTFYLSINEDDDDWRNKRIYIYTTWY